MDIDKIIQDAKDELFEHPTLEAYDEFGEEVWEYIEASLKYYKKLLTYETFKKNITEKILTEWVIQKTLWETVFMFDDIKWGIENGKRGNKVY